MEIDVEKNTELKKKKLWQITILFFIVYKQMIVR